MPSGTPPAGRFALVAALTSSIGQTFFIGLFGTAFRQEFGLGEGGLGWMYGLATILSGVAMFWLGALADALSLRRAIAVSVLALAAGAMLVAVAPAAAVLFGGLLLLRLAGQGLTGHLAVVAAGRYAVRRRGRAVAMATYGFILGEALLPALVALGLDVAGWREVWLVAAAGLVLVALPGLVVLAGPLTGPGPDTPQGADYLPAGRLQLLADGSFLRVLAVVLVPPFVVTALFLHQGSLAGRLGWSLAEVASGFVAFAAAQGLAAFGGGRLIDRFSARVLLRFHLLPAGAGVLSLPLAPPEASLWLMFAGLGLTAGINGVICGAVWVELFGTARLGMIRGVYVALMVISTAVGPVVLGALLEKEVSLLAMGVALAVYVVVLPPVLVPGIRRRE